MQNSFNKGVYLGVLTIVASVFIIIIGCNKTVLFEEPIPIPNTPLTIHTPDLIDIRATDVYTTSDSLQRKIEIIDKSNNTIQDIFYITMKSNDFTTNIYTQLKNKTFAGTLSIVNNDKILFLKEGKNGDNLAASSMAFSKIKSNIVPSCTITVVHNCVANKINQMSIFEYGMCLAAAPQCYGGLWASCGWTNCITGEQR